ncbi:MAG: Peptide methionine sulfoxide reductase MsrA [Desulfovibrio sp.]
MREHFFFLFLAAWLLCGAFFPAAADCAAAGPVRAASAETAMKPSFPMPPLSGQEADVILRKATEAPFSGQYNDKHDAGTYVCRQCGAALYSSRDKFESGCGWPSFDTELPGAVRRVPDADGRRVEIICANCGGHLGHVFEGEGFTARNTRHCVNSLSMTFYPAGSPEEAKALARAASQKCTATAIVAGGCFWGVEDAFRKMPGVCEAVSGYTGGHTPNPTYEAVCTGKTGHAEAVRVRFDPSVVSYEQILRRFFEIHDPTQLNRQGPDVGDQYRSAVFFLDAEQEAVARKLTDRLRDLGYDVVTKLEPAGTFYQAEDYHQGFAERTGRGGCHVSVPRFDVPAGGGGSGALRK